MKASLKKRPAIRPGRPSRELAAKVDERILDAAEHVFLEHGFEGASIDEMAEVARAGKTTIYARYAGKKELFVAVALRNVTSMMQIEEMSPEGATVEARLRILGSNIVERATTHKAIRLFRVTLSEAERFPEIASQVSHLARERGIEEISRLLSEMNDAPGGCSSADPPSGEARIFMDLVVLPMVMRRLFGEGAVALQVEIADHVASRVAFFLAACTRLHAAREVA